MQTNIKIITRSQDPLLHMIAEDHVVIAMRDKGETQWSSWEGWYDKRPYRIWMKMTETGFTLYPEWRTN